MGEGDDPTVEKQYGWEFLFLGANIDAVETAGHLSIASDRAVNYHCDSAGAGLNYEVVGQAVAAVQCSAPLDEHWKDAIEEDFRKRQKRPDRSFPLPTDVVYVCSAAANDLQPHQCAPTCPVVDLLGIGKVGGCSGPLPARFHAGQCCESACARHSFLKQSESCFHQFLTGASGYCQFFLTQESKKFCISHINSTTVQREASSCIRAHTLSVSR